MAAWGAGQLCWPRTIAGGDGEAAQSAGEAGWVVGAECAANPPRVPMSTKGQEPGAGEQADRGEQAEPLTQGAHGTLEEEPEENPRQDAEAQAGGVRDHV